jgi:dolichol-phosphate mannosyltransferase
MGEPPHISIIIPFYNEEATLERLAKELSCFVEANPGLRFEILLVNDGSTDRSRELVLKNQFPKHTRLINLSQNYGSHAALRAGISKAKGLYLTFSYADLQDPLDTIVAMHQQISKGYDIVWAYRKNTQNTFLEKVFSKLYANLMRRYVTPKYPLQGFDVIMFTAKVACEVSRNAEANSNIFLQILTLGFKSSYILYEKQARKAGKSKWTLSKKIKLLIDSFVAFSFAPIRLVSLVGVLFFLFGCIWTGYIIFRKIVFDDLAAGWPALLSILMIGFGITNISLGIIAEYLWRTLDASRKRPLYIIEEMIELDQHVKSENS